VLFYADVANAPHWLHGHERDQIVLTDPPHLDCYESPEEHLVFTQRWLRVALQFNSLIHTCGADPRELSNYLSAATPDEIWVWPQTEGHHFVLGYHVDEPRGAVNPWTKPFGYAAYIAHGDRILDPFCGRGDTLQAARAAGAHIWQGCDINPESVAYVRSL